MVCLFSIYLYCKYIHLLIDIKTFASFFYASIICMLKEKPVTLHAQSKNDNIEWEKEN